MFKGSRCSVPFVSLAALLYGVCVCPAPAQDDRTQVPKEDALAGFWKVIARSKANALVLVSDSNETWRFSNAKATFGTNKKGNIPRDGAVFDLKRNYSASPKRFSLSVEEDDETIPFSYCIFERRNDFLLIKMNILPTISEQEKRGYPRDFAFCENDASVVLLLQKQ